jgi:hypothetical protein
MAERATALTAATSLRSFRPFSPKNRARSSRKSRRFPGQLPARIECAAHYNPAPYHAVPHHRAPRNARLREQDVKFRCARLLPEACRGSNKPGDYIGVRAWRLL